MLRFGIDLGGTKIEIIALDGSQSVLRQRIATPQGDYSATLQAITRLVVDAERQLGGNASVGIGIPGSRSPRDGRIRNANSVCLIGQDLQADLEQHLQRPIRLANDADCFALSEASDGAAAGTASMFGVILGTGVGGGLVIHGQLLTGPNAIAGEWGHNPLPGRSPADGSLQDCYCGRQDCIETFLSGPGWASRCGQGQSAAGLASQPGSPALEQYCQWLARSLASVINILDPEVIVLGGGLSNIQHLYQRVPELWSHWVFSDVVNTRLLPARHGDSSGVRGAAWLWPEEAAPVSSQEKTS